MGDAVSHLSTGDCGVRWTAPAGSIIQHSEHELIVRDEHKLIWHAMISPRPFAAGDGEDAALAADMDASARSAFDAHWHAKPDRTPDEQPPTVDRAWTPLVEAAIVARGAGRCARVIRYLTHEPGDEMVAGHLIVPVAMGTVELRVVAKLDPSYPDHPVARVRSALDATLDDLAITRPATRQRYVSLPDAACAFVPPPRFVSVTVKMAPGLHMLWRGGLDGWKRLLDVWRIGKTAARGDPRPALIESAERIVRGWAREGASEIQIDARVIGEFGGAPQIEQYVRFRGGGVPTHTLLRWWVDANAMIYRIGSNAPPTLTEAALAADLDAVQRTWRAVG